MGAGSVAAAGRACNEAVTAVIESGADQTAGRGGAFEPNMSTTLRFREHEEFQRAALAMALAGSALGLGGYALFRTVASPWAVGAIATGAIVAAMAPELRSRVSALTARLALMLAATVALAVGAKTGDAGGGVAVFAGISGLAFAAGARGQKLWVSVACGAAVALLARHTMLSMATAREFASAPGWVIGAAGGAAFSFVSVLSLLPRHLELVRDDVGEAYDAIVPKMGTGEVRELVDRSHGLWREVAEEIPEGDPTRNIMQEAVLRLFEVARKWQDADTERPGQSVVALTERLESLDRRIDDSSDEVTRDQYRQAKAAVSEQLKYLAAIAKSRGRILARLHNYLAAIERLRMAVVNVKSADASRTAADVQPLISTIQEIGADIESMPMDV